MKAFVLVPVVMSAAVGAQALDVPHVWESNGTHYAALSPQLKVELVKLDVDDDLYAQLSISMNYAYASLQRQVDAILKQNPGASVKRVILQPKGMLELSIPEMKTKTRVMPRPSMEGPYVEDILYVSRAQFEAMVQAQARGEAIVEIRGEILAQGKPLMLECSNVCRIAE